LEYHGRQPPDEKRGLTILNDMIKALGKLAQVNEEPTLHQRKMTACVSPKKNS
jgi:translation initiation factor IF-3